MAEVVACPFCGFSANGELATSTIQLHIEEHHTEDSPFIVDDALPAPSAKVASSESVTNGSATPEENPWIKCTRRGCGEYVLISDVDDHLELHEASAASEVENRKARNRQALDSNDYLDRETLKFKSPTKDRLSGLYPPSKKARSSKEDLGSAISSYMYRDAVAEDSSRSPQKQQPLRPSSLSSNQRGRSLLEYFSGKSYHGPPLKQPPRRHIREPLAPGRLGKRELGPYAFEKIMPATVRRHLLNDAEPYYTNRIGRDGRLHREAVVENETVGIIPHLANICADDRSTVTTYFCDPSVKHVVKLRCDGNFCGYWNIQMLLSYIHHENATNGATPRPLPNILQIQDTIEQAWDAGICSYGRIETGGVRGTRKWIGTHEALAFFTGIGVSVEALSFKAEESPPQSNASSLPSPSQPAVIQLLDHVEAYFISGHDTARHYDISHVTSSPPIYFQRFGHSMTIIGLERKVDGSRNLLVYDPSFATAGPMERLIAGRKAGADLTTLLKPYRRGEVSLSRWDEFEVVV